MAKVFTRFVVILQFKVLNRINYSIINIEMIKIKNHFQKAFFWKWLLYHLLKHQIAFIFQYLPDN